MRVVLHVVLPSLGLLSGCISHPSDAATVTPIDAELTRILIPFLVDGTATRGEMESRLGLPTSEFDRGRLATHRLMAEGSALVAVGRETVPEDPKLTFWKFAEYSLILVYDESGILARHRLLRVR